jgi:hypothetical protein
MNHQRSRKSESLRRGRRRRVAAGRPGGRLDITPSASRLLSSLRDVGYDFFTAVADIVDNSVAAKATRVDIRIEERDAGPRVIVADNGVGMTRATLVEALRLGSRRDYDADDLGKFGLGLKTASLSQCRRLIVVSRHSALRYRIASGTLDLDAMAHSDRWLLPPSDPLYAADLAAEWLNGSTGTVVAWERLDRVVQSDEPLNGWDRRRLTKLSEGTASHLAMVFHRFLEGRGSRRRVRITVNGKRLTPWNPFAPDERCSRELPMQRFEMGVDGARGRVTLRGHVLPTREQFSSAEAFERLSGPRKWNGQQGFYIYRNDRLIQSGGWCGLRAPDEHTKLARIALDFPSELDALFNVNIAKMRVSLPGDLRILVERAVLDVVKAAQASYRGPLKVVHPPGGGGKVSHKPAKPAPQFMELMVALRAAALVTGQSGALSKMLSRLCRDAPDLATAIGYQSPSLRPVKRGRADA